MCFEFGILLLDVRTEAIVTLCVRGGTVEMCSHLKSRIVGHGCAVGQTRTTKTWPPARWKYMDIVPC